MQEVFIRNIKALSMDCVLIALKLLAKEGLYVSVDLVTAIENAIIEYKEEITEKQFEEILIAMREKAFYGRVRKRFWSEFGEKVVKGKPGRPGLWLSRAAASFFYDPHFYQSLTSLWQLRISQGQLSDFAPGVWGVLLSPFSPKPLLHWCQTEFLRLLPSLRPTDILTVLNALMLVDEYRQEVWEHAMDLLALRVHTENRRKMYFVLKGLELDNPPFAQELLRKYREIWTVCQSSAVFGRPKKVMSAKEARQMKEIAGKGYEYWSGGRMLELYSVDCVLPGLKTVIEVIGRPYHISQVDDFLDIFTQAKSRHLLRHGYSVILAVDSLSQNILSHLSSRLTNLNEPRLFSVGRLTVDERVIGGHVERLED